MRLGRPWTGRAGGPARRQGGPLLLRNAPRPHIDSAHRKGVRGRAYRHRGGARTHLAFAAVGARARAALGDVPREAVTAVVVRLGDRTRRYKSVFCSSPLVCLVLGGRRGRRRVGHLGGKGGGGGPRVAGAPARVMTSSSKVLSSFLPSSDPPASVTMHDVLARRLVRPSVLVLLLSSLMLPRLLVGGLFYIRLGTFLDVRRGWSSFILKELVRRSRHCS
jgi:hypothetical protein